MVNFFTQRGSIPGVTNTTNVSTPPFIAPQPTSTTTDVGRAGLSERDLGNILSAVQGTTSVEDFNREFDREFGTGELPSSEPRPTDPAAEGGEIVVAANRTDTRLRLSAMVGMEQQVYGTFDPQSNILSPLWATKGLLFPYTPTVSISGEANWTKTELIHTNYDILSYQRTPSVTLQISGKFTVQNQREGEYALAAIHFLRTMTKMYYGDLDSGQANPQESTTDSGKAGLPPPVLMLNGYGDLMFRNVRVVCQGYSFSFEEGADLVSIISRGGGQIVLPPVFTLQVNVSMQHSPKRLREEFSLDKFRTGELLRKGFI